MKVKRNAYEMKSRLEHMFNETKKNTERKNKYDEEDVIKHSKESKRLYSFFASTFI